LLPRGDDQKIHFLHPGPDPDPDHGEHCHCDDSTLPALEGSHIEAQAAESTLALSARP
jgi:hypothetical protein